MTPALAVTDLCAGYGPVTVLKSLRFEARAGEVTCLMGRNGAGKSTLMKAIMGLIPAREGTIALNGRRVSGLPAHDVPRSGIAYVPQGRRLFGEMTVAENIEIGLMTRGRGAGTREKVLDLFPRLRERLQQTARTLSGGEQQMLALARALCLEPAVLLLDEPTEGLQPSMIRLIRDTVTALKSTGVATVLVEQRVDAVLSMADRVSFMDHGAIAATLDARNLSPTAPEFSRYVGL